MTAFFTGVGLAILAMMLIVFYRVIKGPTAMDRLVGVNVIGTKAMVLLVVIGVLFERVGMFVDIAIGYGLLNFIASIAAAKYFQHHRVMKPELSWDVEEQKS